MVEERVVANDNTIAWDGPAAADAAEPLRPHFVKARVRMHEYPDGTVSVFLGPHRLATFMPGAWRSSSTPTAMSMAPCSEPSRPSPAGRAKSAALTAPAREAFTECGPGRRNGL